jgi:hypothetical protein
MLDQLLLLKRVVTLSNDRNSILVALMNMAANMAAETFIIVQMHGQELLFLSSVLMFWLKLIRMIPFHNSKVL